LEGVFHEPEFRVDRLPRGDHVATLTKLSRRELLVRELLAELVK